MKRRFALLAVLLLSAGLLAGCPKRPEVAQAGPGAVGPGAPTAPATPGPAPSPRAGDLQVTRPTPPAETPVRPAAPGAQSTAAAVPLQDIFFDFDKSNIRDDQKAALNQDVSWLKGNATAKITIEGHADERSTNEYNLALGERRAKATRDYLVAAGVDAARISIVSYGEERPFVLGHDERAWKWNRRAHFVFAPR